MNYRAALSQSRRSGEHKRTSKTVHRRSRTRDECATRNRRHRARVAGLSYYTRSGARSSVPTPRIPRGRYEPATVRGTAAMLYGTYRDWYHLHTSIPVPFLKPEALSRSARQYLRDGEHRSVNYVRGAVISCSGCNLSTPARSGSAGSVLSRREARSPLAQPRAKNDGRGNRLMHEAIEEPPRGTHQWGPGRPTASTCRSSDLP